MMTRLLIGALLFFFSTHLLMAQVLEPVKWTFSAEKVNDQEYDLIFTAHADDGWFIYSQFMGDDGPIPTSLNFENATAFELIGKAAEKGNKKEGYDALFDMDVIKFSGTTQFVQRIKRLNKLEAISGYVEFMCCDSNRCLPPTEVDFVLNLPK